MAHITAGGTANSGIPLSGPQATMRSHVTILRRLSCQISTRCLRDSPAAFLEHSFLFRPRKSSPTSSVYHAGGTHAVFRDMIGLPSPMTVSAHPRGQLPAILLAKSLWPKSQRCCAHLRICSRSPSPRSIFMGCKSRAYSLQS